MWVISLTPRPIYPRENPVPIVQEAVSMKDFMTNFRYCPENCPEGFTKKRENHLPRYSNLVPRIEARTYPQQNMSDTHTAATFINEPPLLQVYFNL
jgi:hypothetical protein